MRHETNIFSQRRPDFVFTKRSGPKKINLLYASFMVELMVGDLDYDHKGKLMLYNEDVLNCNPSRLFIISVLSNLHDVVLLETKIVPNNQAFKYHHTFSKNINFWKSGVYIIEQMLYLPNTVGYDERLNFTIKICRQYLFSHIVKHFILDTLLLL